MSREGQQDLTENEEQNGVLPNRRLLDAELVELKILALETKWHLSNMYGCLKTYDIERIFDGTDEKCDEVGRICDNIIKYCTAELKKPEATRKKRNKK